MKDSSLKEQMANVTREGAQGIREAIKSAAGVSAVQGVTVVPRRVWAVKDFAGTVHIKMQHEGDDPVDFIQIQYDYRCTSNAHQAELTNEILVLLGGEPTFQ